MKLLFLPLGLLGVLAAIGLASREDAPLTAPADPQVRLVEIGRFDGPLHVTTPPGDERLFVVEKAGRIWVVEGERRLPRPFLDISRRVSTRGLEEGLLSLAFAPDYATSGLFYVDYTDHRKRTIIEELRRSTDPDRADPGSTRRVLVIQNPTDRHHGGLVLFGPDGLLYIGQGDGGLATGTNFPAQRIDNLHGKILRIHPRPQGNQPYGIPRDNPFVGRLGRDEIWLYGLRNPWRFSFDRASGALVIGDVGQLSVEEIDVAPRAGLNFGWNCFEGSMPFSFAPRHPASCERATPPVLERVRVATRSSELGGVAPSVTRGRARTDVRLAPGEPVCSVVLGVTVQDPGLPSLRGRTVHGDACNPGLHSFRLENGAAVDPLPLGLDVALLSSFGVDARGRVYATSLSGPVYRLAEEG